MENDYHKKIIADLEQSGYPAELTVSKIASNKKWAAYQNAYYFDKDEEKGREIDLLAIKYFRYENALIDFYAAIYLCVEVKTSRKHPWIIFPSHFLDGDKSLYNFPCVVRNFDDNILKKALRLSELPVYKFDVVGKNYHESFKKINARSQFYGAILSSIKSAAFFASQREKAINEMEKDTERVKYRLELFFPVVVFSGDLFISYMYDVKIEPIPNIPYLQFYESALYTRKQYTVNVTTLDHFGECLEEYDIWADKLFSRLKRRVIARKGRKAM